MKEIIFRYRNRIKDKNGDIDHIAYDLPGRIEQDKNDRFTYWVDTFTEYGEYDGMEEDGEVTIEECDEYIKFWTDVKNAIKGA